MNIDSIDNYSMEIFMKNSELDIKKTKNNILMQLKKDISARNKVEILSLYTNNNNIKLALYWTLLQLTNRTVTNDLYDSNHTKYWKEKLKEFNNGVYILWEYIFDQIEDNPNQLYEIMYEKNIYNWIKSYFNIEGEKLNTILRTDIILCFLEDYVDEDLEKIQDFLNDVKIILEDDTKYRIFKTLSDNKIFSTNYILEILYYLEDENILYEDNSLDTLKNAINKIKQKLKLGKDEYLNYEQQDKITERLINNVAW